MPEQTQTDTQRIEQLEQQVAVLTARIEKLENPNPDTQALKNDIFAAVEGAAQSESLNHFQ